MVDGNANAPAKAIADAFVCSDISKAEATEQGLAKFELAGIMPISDFGVRTAARIAQARGLSGNSPAAALAGHQQAIPGRRRGCRRRAT